MSQLLNTTAKDQCLMEEGGSTAVKSVADETVERLPENGEDKS